MSAHLVVSANGHHDVGGLFHLEGKTLRQIDALPTGAVVQGDGKLYRATHTRSERGAEMLVYDRTGVMRYHRIDAIGNPHDLLWTSDGRLLCVSAHKNEIVRVHGDGSVETVWSANAPPDAWHINCLTERDGRVYATAFGEFHTEMGWRDGCVAKGFLFDIGTGERVVEGLTMPHTPRFMDGAWTICDSGTESFLRVWPDGRRESVKLGGFVRGTCVVGDRIYVGMGLDRSIWMSSSSPHKGYVAVLDRETLRELDRIESPVDSIYDIVSVEPDMLDGLRTGFRFGSIRDSVFGQLAMFEQVGVTPTRYWATGDRLRHEDVRARVLAEFPAVVDAGSSHIVRCKVRNDGTAIFVSAIPHPVYVCYRWFDADGNAVGEGTWIHTPLLRLLPPGEEHGIDAEVRAPDAPGTYTLRITLLQAGAWWFDDVDIANAATFVAAVRERAPALEPASTSG